MVSAGWKGLFCLKKYTSPEIEITKAEALDVLNGSGTDTDIPVGDLFDVTLSDIWA